MEGKPEIWATDGEGYDALFANERDDFTGFKIRYVRGDIADHYRKQRDALLEASMAYIRVSESRAYKRWQGSRGYGGESLLDLAIRAAVAACRHPTTPKIGGLTMKTRCKLKVIEVAELEPTVVYRPTHDDAGKGVDYEPEENTNRRQRVRFVAAYDDTIPEDLRFQKATPSGEMELYIDNQAIIDGFKPGASYYVDLTPCEE